MSSVRVWLADLAASTWKLQELRCRRTPGYQSAGDLLRLRVVQLNRLYHSREKNPIPQSRRNADYPVSRWSTQAVRLSARSSGIWWMQEYEGGRSQS